MKTLATLFGLGFGLTAAAQSIEIFIDGQTVDVSGTVVTVAGGETIHEQFDIYNASVGSLDLKCTRVKISETTGTSDYLCWGLDLLSGVCYSASTVGPSDPWTTPDMFTWAPGDTGLLSVYYLANANPGTSVYRYYIVEDGPETLLDSVDVEFVSTVSINEIPKMNVSVYPNPAKGSLNVLINGTASEEYQMVVYGLAGEKVLTTNLTDGVNKVDIARLSPGVYFYSVLFEQVVIETRKLIVR